MEADDGDDNESISSKGEVSPREDVGGGLGVRGGLTMGSAQGHGRGGRAVGRGRIGKGRAVGRGRRMVLFSSAGREALAGLVVVEELRPPKMLRCKEPQAGLRPLYVDVVKVKVRRLLQNRLKGGVVQPER